MIWVEIDCAPSVAFYRETGARDSADADIVMQALTGVGTLRMPLSIPGVDSAENANITVTLDNADGRITRLFAHDPPIRAVGRIVSDDGDLFTGVVTSVTLSDTASISLESGLVRPLTDTLPLRAATVWGDFERVETLPIPYGRVTLAAVRYTDTAYLCADCPIVGVDSVTVDGAQRLDWRHRNGVDSTGRAVAFVEFGAPIDVDSDVAVTLRGRPHPTTGALMTAPDEILWDVLSNVCGLPLTAAQLDDLRIECVGLEIGGVLADRTRSVRAQVDEIVQSIGGAWSAGAQGLAMIFPLVDYGDRPTDVHVDRLTATEPASESTHADLATVVRLDYDHDWSTGEPSKSIEVVDAEGVRLYGRIETTLSASWLHSERMADALARRWLAWLTVPKWRVSWRSADIGARPGDWAEIDHPRIPITGRHRIVGVESDYDRLSATLSVLAQREPQTVVYPTPETEDIRVTESGDARITEAGDTRVLE